MLRPEQERAGSHSHLSGGPVGAITWFEFATVNEDEESKTDVVARLTRLLDIATKLAGAGWPLRLTMSGVAFEAPEDEVADQLAALGIEEPFASPPVRTLDEVCEAIGRLNDRRRRGQGLDPQDFGRLSALYWILGVDEPRDGADRLEPARAAA